MMKQIFLIACFIMAGSMAGKAQYWKHTVTAAYQQQAEALPTPEPPIYAMELPVTLPVVFHIVHPPLAPSLPPSRSSLARVSDPMRPVGQSSMLFSKPQGEKVKNKAQN